MFNLDPECCHMMPAHFGPRPVPPESTGWYRDVTMMVVSFITDRDKLAAYLPAPYEVGENPVVTVTYACNRKVDWLAGRGYNLVGVSASAVYRGEHETLEGNYSLVMWENLTDPILRGREVQGIPKIYADIQDHSVVAGEWRTSASHFGNKILDMMITDLREPTAEEIVAQGQATAGRSNPLAWRYLPAVGGIGHSISEPTTFPSHTELDEVRVGQGRIDWNQLTWEQNPTQFHIVNALAQLPVLAWLPAMVASGSVNLTLPENPARALR